MEHEHEVLSGSETSDSDSGEEFTADSQEDDEEEELDDAISEINQPSSTARPEPPSDEDRKSKNVDALLRYARFFGLWRNRFP